VCRKKSLANVLLHREKIYFLYILKEQGGLLINIIIHEVRRGEEEEWEERGG